MSSLGKLPPIDAAPPLQARERPAAEQEALDAELDALHASLGVRRGHALQEALRPERVPYENLMSAAAALAGSDAAWTLADPPQAPPPAQLPAPPVQLLALPAPEDSRQAVTLDCSTGEMVVMEALGPVIVNIDGTLARISNWNEMMVVEQAVARRRVAKRNIERLRAFRERGELGEGLVSALADPLATER